MVRTTRQQVKHGADWIKIHVTGLLPNRPGERTVWTLDELRAVVDTAHALDTPIVAHCRNADSRMPATSSGCSSQKAAIWSNEREVSSISHTAVALGMRTVLDMASRPSEAFRAPDVAGRSTDLAKGGRRWEAPPAVAPT